MRWKYRVRIKDLLNESEDYETIQATMNAIAERLDRAACFSSFNKQPLQSIPKGDSIFKPIDYANRLLDRIYDYADSHDIWIS